MQRMTWVRQLAVAMVCIGSCVAAARAQEKNEPITKFEANTQLVVVPVIVTDRDGKHVTTLTKDDFVVSENGSEKKIAFFEHVTSTTAIPAQPKPELNTYTNVLQGTAGMRVTVLLLDLLNTTWRDRAYAKEALIKYLAESLDSTEPTALFVLNHDGLHVIHDFTTDPRVLAEMVKKAQGSPSQLTTDPVRAENDARDLEKAYPDKELAGMLKAIQDANDNFASLQQKVVIELTLNALQQMSKYLAGVPGRKSVVWATGSFPFSVSDTSVELPRAGQYTLGDVMPLYESTWKSLNDANVALYPVDVRGLMGLSTSNAELKEPMVMRHGQVLVNRADFVRDESLDSMRVFADATGGQGFMNNNDITRGFREAAKDGADYYQVAYYLAKTAKPGWHRLKVNVKTSGLHVRARNGFLVPRSNVLEKSREADLKSALTSPVNFAEIPMVFRWKNQTAASDGKHRRVNYELVLPPNVVTVDEGSNNLLELQLAASVRTIDGSQVGAPEVKNLRANLKADGLSQIRNNGITYRQSLELSPGNYVVRFVVRDSLSGRMGSVLAPLEVNN